jgi:PAS domain S-box-containing protein
MNIFESMRECIEKGTPKIDSSIFKNPDIFRRAFDQAPVGEAILDHALRLTRVNASLCRLTGYSQEELLCMGIADLIGTHAEIHTGPGPCLTTRARTPPTGAMAQRVVFFRKNGEEVPVRLWMHPLETEKKRSASYLLTAQMIDTQNPVRKPISESETDAEWVPENTMNMKRRWVHSNRMEALGRLAGGVAHDFNNLMTVVIGFTDLILINLAKDDPFRPDILEIQKAGKHAAALSSRLLEFGREQLFKIELMNLNELILNNCTMLRHLMGGRVTLVTNLDPRLWRIESDPGQTELVLMNLAVNAKDAMPQGGSVAIRTENVRSESAPYLMGKALKDGNYVCLSISDTGVGMEDKTLARIFDPFFTTKLPGKGTGLGLFTAQEIVKQLGGNIQVSSKPGKGTSFKVYFPKALGKTPAPPAAADSAETLKGEETILVVVGEERLRKLILKILKFFGYQGLEAKNGARAIEMSKEFTGRIDLLLTDVIMPEITGNRLEKEIKTHHPDIKILFMSGYSLEDVAPYGVIEGGKAFLSKPFTALSMMSKIRETLNRLIDEK